MSFRLEYATSARSGCKATECKTQSIKINKNELRHVSFFTIDGERQGKAYRHWGCVTPRQIANINKAIEGNLDYLDGYDDLNDDDQAKVRQALEDGHVADEDWRHDPEMNRPGKTGFRSPAKKAAEKAAKNAKEEQDQGKGPSKPTPKKKRARAKKEDDSDAESEPEVMPKKKSRAAPKKHKKEDEDEAEAEIKPEKKSREAHQVKKEGNSDTDAPVEPKSRKKVKEEEEIGAETLTKAKHNKSKAASRRIKAEMVENEELLVDNASSPRTSSRQAKKGAANVKAERSESGEEGQEAVKAQDKAPAKKAGKKAAPKVVTGSSAASKVKEEEEGSDGAFEVSELPKRNGGRKKKPSDTSTAQESSRQTGANGRSTRSTGRATRSNHA